MNIEGTNSAGTELRPSGAFTSWSSGKLALVGGILAFASSGLSAPEHMSRMVIEPAWRPASTIGVGTARAVHTRANRYQPKTELGRRLLALRTAAIAKGMPLIPAERIASELEAFRG